MEITGMFHFTSASGRDCSIHFECSYKVVDALGPYQVLQLQYITVILLYHCNWGLSLQFFVSTSPIVSCFHWCLNYFSAASFAFMWPSLIFLSQFPASRPRIYGPLRWHQTRRWSHGPSPHGWPWMGFWRATVWCSGPSTPMEVGAVGARHLDSIRVIIRYYCYSLTRRSPRTAPPIAHLCICIPVQSNPQRVYICGWTDLCECCCCLQCHMILQKSFNQSAELVLKKHFLFSILKMVMFKGIVLKFENSVNSSPLCCSKPVSIFHWTQNMTFRRMMVTTASSHWLPYFSPYHLSQ